MRKISCITIVLFVLFSLLSINVLAQSSIKIYVENTSVAVNEEIIVPVKVSNNIGICGATLAIAYDETLVLKSINSGDALTSLILTKPGNLTANPFNLVYDGMEQDSTNGVIAYLCFEPVSDAGTYNISVSYEDGDIVDGNLLPVDVEVMEGNVTVEETASGGENEDDEKDEPEHNGPVVTIGNVVSKPGQTIDVPVYLTGNTGICGATLNIAYDTSLILESVTKGDSFSGLIMTKPGNMTANPFNLVFDGIEEDTTNGLFFTLTFTVPLGNGKYDISATYQEGDIVDGNLLPVDVLIKNGSIGADSDYYEISIGTEKVILPNKNVTDGKIYVAFYKNDTFMTSVVPLNLDNKIITVDVDYDASFAKVFCWTNKLNPLCDKLKVTLK